MTNIQLTQELVQYIFDYKDGFLIYKIKQSRFHNNVVIGAKAGTIRKFVNCERRIIKVNGKDYIAARLIFFYHYNYWPFVVDHENHDTLDDRIENLRPASKGDNNKNTSSRIGSTSKYLGVCILDGKWVASIWVNNRSLTIGRYIYESDAALAYNREAVRYHKEFANLNIITP